MVEVPEIVMELSAMKTFTSRPIAMAVLDTMAVGQSCSNFFWCLTGPYLVILLLRQNLKPNFDHQWITLVVPWHSRVVNGFCHLPKFYWLEESLCLVMQACTFRALIELN